MIAEHGGDGAWQRIYFRLEGELLGGAKRGGPRIGAIHVDHLGTPQKVTDETAAVVWDAVYRPFGATESVTGPLTFNLRFPGQYYDAETGLHYNYFRDYDPGTGRYLESDPIGLGGGWNTYAYVGGNPVMRVDPDGLESIIGDFGAVESSACARSCVTRSLIGFIPGAGLIYGGSRLLPYPGAAIGGGTGGTSVFSRCIRRITRSRIVIGAQRHLAKAGWVGAAGAYIYVVACMYTCPKECDECESDT